MVILVWEALPIPTRVGPFGLFSLIIFGFAHAVLLDWLGWVSEGVLGIWLRWVGEGPRNFRWF